MISAGTYPYTPKSKEKNLGRPHRLVSKALDTLLEEPCLLLRVKSTHLTQIPHSKIKYSNTRTSERPGGGTFFLCSGFTKSSLTVWLPGWDRLVASSCFRLGSWQWLQWMPLLEEPAALGCFACKSLCRIFSQARVSLHRTGTLTIQKNLERVWLMVGPRITGSMV